MRRSTTGHAPSALLALREATQVAHADLSRRVLPDETFANLDHYRWFLARLWGFHRAVELAQPYDPLAQVSGRPPRAELLAADLGCVDAWTPHLPLMTDLPLLRSHGALLGVAYVVEGSALGGIQLLALAEQRFGLKPTSGAAFFAAGAAGVPRWQQVKRSLHAQLADPATLAEAQRSASTLFSALAAWMAESAIPDGT